MKQKILITAIALCLIAAGCLTVNAFPGYSEGRGHGTSHNSDHINSHSNEHQDMSNADYEEYHQDREHDQNDHDRNTGTLELTDEQVDQIKSIRAEAMATIDELRDKIAEREVQIRELIGEEYFDEDAVRAMAMEKADVQVELTVAQSAMRNSIQAVLTEEQLELTKSNRSGGHHTQREQHHGSAEM